jgi:hypothetical protein
VVDKGKWACGCLVVDNQLEEPIDDNVLVAVLTSFELLSLYCTGDSDHDAEFQTIVMEISRIFNQQISVTCCGVLMNLGRAMF